MKTPAPEACFDPLEQHDLGETGWEDREAPDAANKEIRMPRRPTTIRPDHIAIDFAPERDKSKEFTLEKEDIERIGQLGGCIKSAMKVYGQLTEPPRFGDAIARIYFVSGDAFNSAQGLLEDLLRTADELQKNADSKDPRPHDVAISRPALVPFLRAVARAHVRSGLRVSLWLEGKEFLLPALDVASFVEPERDEKLRKADVFALVGVRKDAVHGHRVILSESDFSAVLPLNDPDLKFERIHAALLCHEAWIEGVIERGARGEPWRLLPGARIVTQSSALD
jgi:hypothetical protein